MTAEEEVLFMNYYNLTNAQKEQIKSLKKDFGMTVNEIARKFQITDPDVNRILHPPKNYGNWTAEDKKRHWLAGQKRARTVKKQRDDKTEELRRGKTQGESQRIVS